MSKILVTGGSGFIGAALVKAREHSAVGAAVPLTHGPEKLVLDLIGDRNRFPAFAKPASAGEGRSDKTMRKR